MELLIAAGAAAFVYFAAQMLFYSFSSGSIRVSERLAQVEKLHRAEREEDELDQPFTERLLKPLFQRLVRALSLLIPVNGEMQKRMESQLLQAGIRRSVREYNTLVLLFTLICICCGIVATSQITAGAFSYLVGALFGLYTGFVLCRFYLKRKITERKNGIQQQLPDTLDLLSVSVSAGLGFDQALSYVVEKSKGPLIDELDVARREIALGRKRKEALRRFSERCGGSEIQTFVSAVIQADELGSSMQNVLAIQSDTIRQAHKQKVEEKAQKLSIKMLIPIVLFIFPVIFIVLLGPAVPSIIAAFSEV